MNQKRAAKRFVRAAVIGAILSGCAFDAQNPDTQDEEEGTVGEVHQDIYYGTPAGVNFAVVEISRNGNESRPCSAYFITRRHIVTAAHCTDRGSGSQWYRVRIKTGYGKFTNLKDTQRTDTWVLLRQTLAPGWNYDRPQAAYDTAMLTVPTSAANSVPANQDILRISTAAPVVGQSHGIWGWGANKITTGGPARPYDLLYGDLVSVSGVSAGWFRAIGTGSRLTCVGDSGGPSTRYHNGYYVASGTHRGNLNDPRCAAPADQMLWSDTSHKISWIEGTLRETYGSRFTCTRYSSGSSAYMKCF